MLQRQQQQEQPALALACRSLGSPSHGGSGSASAQTGTGQQVQQRQDGEEAEAEKVCSHCGADSSGHWCRHPVTQERLCTACHHYMRNHGGQERPVGVQCLQCGAGRPGNGDSVAWRPHPTTCERWLCSPCFHEAQRQAQQRQCLECGADSSGPPTLKRTSWMRHPATGAEWVCQTCYARVRGQLKQHSGRHKEQPAGSGEQPGRKGEQQAPSCPSAPLRQGQKQRAQHTRQQKQPEADWTEEVAGKGEGRSQPPQGSTSQPPTKWRRQAVGLTEQPSSEGRPSPCSLAAAGAPKLVPLLAGLAGTARPQQAQQNLLCLLVDAACQPGAAGSGLTPELTASFSALMDTLPPDQQAAKDSRLHMLLAKSLHTAAAHLMATAARLAGLAG